MKSLDFKICTNCNSECRHCVLGTKELRKNIEDTEGKLDFQSTIQRLDSLLGTGEYDSILITGGEPTSLSYLGNILKYISVKYKDVEIAMQTNGRWLSRFVDDIEFVYKRRPIHFVIPILHYDNNIHDTIVGRKGALQETLYSISVLQERLNGKLDYRTETVMLKQNINDLSDITEYLISIGVEYMGFGFPDFEIYSDTKTYDIIQTMSITYNDLKQQVAKLKEIHNKYANKKFAYSNTPICVFDGEVSNNVMLPAHTYSDKLVVFLDGVSVSDEEGRSVCHTPAEQCSKCRYYRNCSFPFKYTVNYYGDNSGIIPILEEN